jgi:hypothetical protein
MATHSHPAQPEVGMMLAFKQSASEALAGVPAYVIGIWPRFRTGDYLVTLEYAQPVKVGKQLVSRIDAFVSELYQPGEHALNVPPAANVSAWTT